MTLGTCDCGGDLKLQIRYAAGLTKALRTFWLVCEICRVEEKATVGS